MHSIIFCYPILSHDHASLFCLATIRFLGGGALSKFCAWVSLCVDTLDARMLLKRACDELEGSNGFGGTFGCPCATAFWHGSAISCSSFSTSKGPKGSIFCCSAGLATSCRLGSWPFSAAPAIWLGLEVWLSSLFSSRLAVCIEVGGSIGSSFAMPGSWHELEIPLSSSFVLASGNWLEGALSSFWRVVGTCDGSQISVSSPMNFSSSCVKLYPWFFLRSLWMRVVTVIESVSRSFWGYHILALNLSRNCWPTKAATKWVWWFNIIFVTVQLLILESIHVSWQARGQNNYHIIT